MKYVLLALTLCFCATFATAQPAPASRAALDSVLLQQQRLQHQVDSLTTALRTMCTMDERGKQMVEESQRSMTNALGTTRFVAALIGLLATLIGIVVAFGTTFGFFQFKSAKEQLEHASAGFLVTKKEVEEKSEGMERLLKEMLQKVQDATNEIEVLKQMRQKLAEEIASMQKELPEQILDIAPVDELKAKYDTLSQRIDLLEALGGELTSDDWFTRGVNLFNAGLYEQAIKAFEEVLALKSDSPDALYNIGIAHGRLQRNREALQAFESALAIKQDHAEALACKGIALAQLERYPEALAAYNEALVLKPDHALSWYSRARFYASQGNQNESLADLKHAIELDAKYKQKAKANEAFKSFWDDPEFKQIVGE